MTNQLNAPAHPYTKTAAAAVVGAGIAAGLAVWAIATAAGADLEVGRNGNMSSVGAANVVIAALVGGLAAWAVNWFMVSRGWARWWPAAGIAALVLSTNGPTFLAEGSGEAILSLMHLAVGSVLIVGFALVSG